MPAAPIPDRAIVSLSGPEARTFLDGLVTCDVEGLSPDQPRYGGLLSPQGKIIADFLLFQSGQDQFLFDTPATCGAELTKRLTLYRLRAKLDIRDRSGDLRVVAGSPGEAAPTDALAGGDDPRHPALGWRRIVPASSGAVPTDPEHRVPGHPVPSTAETGLDGRRIVLGVPASGRDFALGDAFPHEALMDQLGGVDFKKGCYVGQEVVSRMQHRGTARTRIVSLLSEGGTTLTSGQEVSAGGRPLGRVGSVTRDRALALLRLDRAADALAAGEAIVAGGVPVVFDKPDWVRFAYPDELPVAAA